jgi:chromosomal replication initiation ATPase DnaA
MAANMRPNEEEQLPLDFPVDTRLGPDDFLPAPANEAALALVSRWPDWPDRIVSLVGPAGSGKSHLAAIWASRAGARKIDPLALPSLATLTKTVPTALLIDDADRVVDEKGLFHLLNFVIEHRLSLLMTRQRPPLPAEVALPDLLSRLRRAPAIEIGSPDEKLVIAVLEKLCRDRQLSVDASTLSYVGLRLERSLDAARAFVVALDRAALSQGRAATRALAADVLARFNGDAQEIES